MRCGAGVADVFEIYLLRRPDYAPALYPEGDCCLVEVEL